MTKSKKFFPIVTDTACKLKWSWNTLRLYNGMSGSCHRVLSGIVDAENFKDFHNSPKHLSDRQAMLEGKWPQGGCNFCENAEKHGGMSDRQFHLKIPDQYPPELDTSPDQIRVDPTILEIYIDNVCNLSCVYCNDIFSSKIQQENVKYGLFDQAGVVIQNQAVKHPQHEKLKEEFWKWMDSNSVKLDRLLLLGGEPLYQKDFEKFLLFLESRPHTNLEFNVVSNLMVKTDTLMQYVSRIEALVAKRYLKRFEITASIDCFGPEQEYVRFGLDLDVWRKNFEYLVSKKWITLNINQTLSVLTIKTVPELVRYINQFKPSRKIGHYMSTTLYTYDFLHLKIFGSDFFADDFKNIFDEMRSDTWQEIEAVKFLQGVVGQYKNSSRDQTEIDKLAVFLDEIDRRRDLNWRTTFPWLTKEVSHA